MPLKILPLPTARPKSAVAEPTVEQEEKTATETDVPWNVVVHNDPITKMNYVTMVFEKVFRFTQAKAETHMWEVHRRGRSIVWSGVRERAELYVQQLHGYQLIATMEKAL